MPFTQLHTPSRISTAPLLSLLSSTLLCPISDSFRSAFVEDADPMRSHIEYQIITGRLASQQLGTGEAPCLRPTGSELGPLDLRPRARCHPASTFSCYPVASLAAGRAVV
ncbi:hypothetical protein FKP32DRAFT_1593304 [Trametes sanguinea]|nr:hypothetical protein FKP32DRAFT_1593304 [Trametes sanguinea]